MSSLLVSVFNFNSIKSKQTLIILDLSKESTQAENIFYITTKLNKVSIIVFPDWQLLHQVSKYAILDPIIH